MGVQAILNNVKTVGVKETYNISRKRKQERITDHKVVEMLRKMLAGLAEKETSEEAAALMRKGAGAKEDEEVRAILCELDQMRSKAYKSEIKRKYIKEILPMIYDDFRHFHIEDVAIFMQPRSGLNQSCKYIYNKLKNDGKYHVVLRELHRGEVGT